MLFTFAKSGNGKTEAMTVDDDKEFNHLHPQTSNPSTTELIKTKVGFRHLFTERANESKEVFIHFRWNAKEHLW